MFLLANPHASPRGRHYGYDATRKRLAHCPEAYSPKCLVGEFSEVRIAPVRPSPHEPLDGSTRAVRHQPEAPSHGQGIEEAPAPRAWISPIEVALQRPLILLVRQPHVEPRPPRRLGAGRSVGGILLGAQVPRDRKEGTLPAAQGSQRHPAEEQPPQAGQDREPQGGEAPRGPDRERQRECRERHPRVELACQTGAGREGRPPQHEQHGQPDERDRDSYREDYEILWVTL